MPTPNGMGKEMRVLGLVGVCAAVVAAAATASQRTDEEAARIAAVTAPAVDFSQPEPFERLPAGAATSRASVNRNAFSQPSANMSFERQLDFKVGNGIFKRLWVSAPSTTRSSDGLGPLFNARACQRCHIKDGRGHPPAANWPDDNALSMLMRLSIPPQTEADRTAIASHQANAVPDPVYGGQLQDVGIQGQVAEGKINITYEEEPVTLADGTVVSLRRPTYTIDQLGFGALHPDVMLSPRIAPPMIGLGLLEAVPADEILANADPDDADGDGISGMPNIVWDLEAEAPALGRFGLKAGQPTVRQQVAAAFSGDIGISTSLFPAPAGDCTVTQSMCRDAPHGSNTNSEPEVSDELLDLVTFYSRNLAVPARRNIDDPNVLAGKRIFYESGCAACHTPKFVTARETEGPEQSFQLIWPYSDMLLHDMGPGLADGSPEGLANGQEWRTAPLWGIGLTETVNGHTFFLHDGRARNLLEAILWHGGEAEAAKQRVVGLSAADRNRLIAFLESL